MGITEADLQTTPDKPDPSSRWAKIQGLDIHYKCLGSGPPLVMIHGSGNDWHEWQENLTFFARGFRVYAPDMPGFGLSQSPGSPLSPSWSASFLRDFMEATGIEAAHIIGHSLGGIVALYLALSFPDKVMRLVLVDSGGLGEVGRKAQLRLLLIRGVKRIAGKEERRAKLQKSPKEDWILLSRLRGLQPRTMIVWGERDPYLSSSQAVLAHSLIPNCELPIFPSCGHAPQRERADEFNKLVHEFLTT